MSKEGRKGEREEAHIEAERKSVRTQNREEKRTAECRGGRAARSGVTDRLAE